MNNLHVTSASSLITTAAARRNGFLEYALRRNKEAIPFIDKGKALKATLEAHSSKPKDILNIFKIRESLIEAAGISVKAKAHLSDEDKDRLPLIFIGAAIESAMSVEIFSQYQSGDLANCANLTSDEQLAALCEWLVGI
jgi:isocitrate dehydrogenase